MDFITFRLRALQALSLVPVKQRKVMTKTEIENHLKREYERHYKARQEG